MDFQMVFEIVILLGGVFGLNKYSERRANNRFGALEDIMDATTHGGVGRRRP